MKIYCLKCKENTNTHNMLEYIFKKKEPMIKGNCVECNTEKCISIRNTENEIK